MNQRQLRVLVLASTYSEIANEILSSLFIDHMLVVCLPGDQHRRKNTDPRPHQRLHGLVGQILLFEDII